MPSSTQIEQFLKRNPRWQRQRRSLFAVTDRRLRRVDAIERNVSKPSVASGNNVTESRVRICFSERIVSKFVEKRKEETEQRYDQRTERTSSGMNE